MEGTDDSIVIRVVDQMYESDSFFEETITMWESLTEDEKCQQSARSSLSMHRSYS